MINIFDISTLVTDRTQADVQAWNDKGTYNPSDLNRVTHAMEYLVERIRSYGYAVKHEKVKVPHQPQRGKSRLPAGYTELEYIESTGTQYIDTGFIPNNNTRIVAKILLPVIEKTDARFAFGARTSASSKAFTFLTSYYGYYMSNYGTDSGAMATSFNKSEPFVVDKNKNITSIDGVVALTSAEQTFTAPGNLMLFGIYDNGTISKNSLTFYSCQVYDNDTLIRDFVPCTNTSGTVGLYDMVNGTFYSNVGTGVFTAGAEVELPSVEILDDYTWYHSDIPQANELNAYLQNVRWLRDAMVLYPNTPEVPDDMQGFTFAEANDIEQILVNIETIINLMLSSIIYSGEIFSGEVI